MSGRECKAAIDCNGEIMEAIHNVPLLAVNDHLTDEALDAYNEMKPRWAAEYIAWKSKYVSFDPDDDPD